MYVSLSKAEIRLSQPRELGPSASSPAPDRPSCLGAVGLRRSRASGEARRLRSPLKRHLERDSTPRIAGARAAGEMPQRFTLTQRKRRRRTNDDEHNLRETSGDQFVDDQAVHAVDQADTLVPAALTVSELLTCPPEIFTRRQLVMLLWTTDYVELMLLELRQHPDVAVSCDKRH